MLSTTAPPASRVPARTGGRPSRGLLIDLAAGAVVLTVGLATVATYGSSWTTALPAPALAAVAVVLRRRAPAAALVAVAVAAFVQRASGTPLSPALLAAFVVLYSAAAYGRRATVWLSGVVSAALTVVAVQYVPVGFSFHLLVTWSAASGTPDVGRRAVIWLIVLFGSAPAWLSGLLRRAALARRADAAALVRAQAEAARAAAAADAQQQRAALARDVHDVVGHSLTVIIALAESVRFRDLSVDDQAAEVVSTSALIAESARESLTLVRDVLSGDAPAVAAEAGPTTTMHDLLRRVRDAGLVVEVTHDGEPRDLPDEQRRVLLAVVQELLTNAFHHADIGKPVTIGYRWQPEDLVVEVATKTGDAPRRRADPHRAGLGLPGIRARLADVHGTMAVRTERGTARYVTEVHLPGGAPRPHEATVSVVDR